MSFRPPVEKCVQLPAALETWATEHTHQLSDETQSEVAAIAAGLADSALGDRPITDPGDELAVDLNAIFPPNRALRAATLIGIVAKWAAARPAESVSEVPAAPDVRPDAAASASASASSDSEEPDSPQHHRDVPDEVSNSADPADPTDHAAATTKTTPTAAAPPRFAAPAVALPQADRPGEPIEAPTFLNSDRVDEEDDVRLYGPKRPWKSIVGTLVTLAILAGAIAAGWYWFTQRDVAEETTSDRVESITPAPEEVEDPATGEPVTAAETPTAVPETAPPEVTELVTSYWADIAPILNSGTAAISSSTYAVSPSNRAVLTGHTAAITGLVVSDEGRVLTSGADRRLVDWGADVTLTSPEVLNVPAPLTVLERTVDQRILAGDTQGNITILSMIETTDPVILPIHDAAISAATELSDGQFAVASVDGDVAVLDIATPDEVRTLPHDMEVTAVVGLANGTIATASVDGVVRLWPADGGAIAEISTLGAPVTALVALADGSLAAASVAGRIDIFDPVAGAAATVEIPGHVGAVRALHEITLFDGTTALASGGDDTTVRLWNPTTAELLVVLEGHGDIISGVDSLPDGRLVSASGDGTGRVWDLSVESGNRVIAPHDSNLSAMYPWNNDLFVTGGTDGKIMLASTAETSEPTFITQHDSSIVGISVLQTGDIVSLDAGSVLRINQADANAAGLIELNLSPGATALAVRDSLGVVTGHADGSVRFHDFDSEVAVVEAHGSGVNDVVSLTSGLVVSAGQDMTVQVIDFEDPTTTRVFDLHTTPVDVVIELPDGRIASAGSDAIYIWSVDGLADGHIRLNGQRSRTISLVGLSGDRLISTGDDGRIRLWDLNSPESEPTTLVDIPGVVNPYLIQADNGLFVAGAARGYVVFTLT